MYVQTKFGRARILETHTGTLNPATGEVVTKYWVRDEKTGLQFSVPAQNAVKLGVLDINEGDTASSGQQTV